MIYRLPDSGVERNVSTHRPILKNKKMNRQERDLSFSLHAAGVASSTVTQDFFFFRLCLTDDSLKKYENVLVDRHYF